MAIPDELVVYVVYAEAVQGEEAGDREIVLCDVHVGLRQQDGQAIESLEPASLGDVCADCDELVRADQRNVCADERLR